MATVSRALGGSPTPVILSRIESAHTAGDYDIPRMVAPGKMVQKVCVSKAEADEVNASIEALWVTLVAASPDREKPAPKNLTLPKTRIGKPEIKIVLEEALSSDELPDGTAAVIRLLKFPCFANSDALVAEVAKRADLKPDFVKTVIIVGKGSEEIDSLIEERLFDAVNAIEAELTAAPSPKERIAAGVLAMQALGFESKASMIRALAPGSGYAQNSVNAGMYGNGGINIVTRVADLLEAYVAENTPKQKQA